MLMRTIAEVGSTRKMVNTKEYIDANTVVKMSTQDRKMNSFLDIDICPLFVFLMPKMSKKFAINTKSKMSK